MKQKRPLIGFYAGSFDPVTLGHLDIITRATGFVDELVIGIGVHHGKPPLFSADERVKLLQAEAKSISKKSKTPITVVTFDNLLVDAAKSNGARLVIRGLRDSTDLDYEAQMSTTNAAMSPKLETVFLLASPGVRHITSSLVRQIAVMGGDVEPFVSKAVAKALRAKASKA